jgi:hypothetical protein
MTVGLKIELIASRRVMPDGLGGSYDQCPGGHELHIASRCSTAVCCTFVCRGELSLSISFLWVARPSYVLKDPTTFLGIPDI